VLFGKIVYTLLNEVIRENNRGVILVMRYSSQTLSGQGNVRHRMLRGMMNLRMSAVL
jgi:hypothetical protein